MKPPDETSGAPPSRPAATAETADYVTIRRAEKLAPFLINVVTAGSGWMFAGSNGAVTAGRVSPYRALLPSMIAVFLNASTAGGFNPCRIERGGDGRLLRDAEGRIVRATLAAKLLIPVLVKIGNLVPGGGVWLNTQRPVWNDANNALAGWGLSVVTTAQLFRHLAFLEKVFGAGAECHLPAAARDLLFELAALARRARESGSEADAAARFVFLRECGEALDRFWARAYTGDLGGAAAVSAEEITGALQNCRALAAATLGASRRADGLFHSYNLLEIRAAEARIGRLDLMLKGQVAVLASGWLPAGEAPPLLDAMRRSPLWREDQRAYLLYPDREVKPVLERNTFETGGVTLFAALAAAGDRSLAVPGRGGRWHFAPALRNPRDPAGRLDALGADERFREAVAREREAVIAKWEEVFGHSRFTGRSGGMFAFEGLGSVYWHMAAKLLLAAGELAVAAPGGSEAARALAANYSEIRAGLGFKKTAAEFGAFPCDPCSHTPAHAGAQQPGMTGQVKEEILTLSLELGARLEGGVFRFEPALMEGAEFEGPGGALPPAGGRAAGRAARLCGIHGLRCARRLRARRGGMHRSGLPRRAAAEAVGRALSDPGGVAKPDHT